MRSLITTEDVIQRVLDQLAAENECKECGSDTTEAEAVNNHHWHGVVVKCQKCGETIAEIDTPEGGWL